MWGHYAYLVFIITVVINLFCFQQVINCPCVSLSKRVLLSVDKCRLPEHCGTLSSPSHSAALYRNKPTAHGPSSLSVEPPNVEQIHKNKQDQVNQAVLAVPHTHIYVYKPRFVNMPGKQICRRVECVYTSTCVYILH